MTRIEPSRPRWTSAMTALALLVIAAARFGLMGDIHGFCRNLEVDDFLYARSADSITEGLWLGPYDARTLVKMPGYSIWLAGLELVGIPTRLGQEGIWILAALTLFLALRRLGLGRFLSVSIFGLVLFHPIAAWGQNNMLVRETIHHAQMLLMASLMLFFLAPGRDRQRLVTGVILGLVTSFIWYSREESLWLLGVLALGVIPALFLERKRAGFAAALRLAFFALLPTAIIVHGSGLAIRALNEHYYGEPVLIAFEDPDFKAAMGAIMRAEPEPAHAFLPIRDTTLAELCAVSPALNEMRDYLLGRAYRSGEMIDVDGNRIANFFTFALRYGAAGQDHHRNLTEAKRYYRQIADEVNLHLDRDLARHGPRRDSVIPPLRMEHIPAIAREMLALTIEMAQLRYEGKSPFPGLPFSNCPPDREQLIKRVMRDPEEPSLSRWSWRTRILWRILEAHRLLLPWVTSLAPLVLLLRLCFIRTRPLGLVTWAGAILILIGLLRAGLVATINVVYSPLGTTYLVAGFLLFAAGAILVLADVLRELPIPWRDRIGAASPTAALGLILVIGAIGYLGWDESRVSRRFLSAVESRRIRTEGEADAVETINYEMSASANDGLTLRAVNPNPTLTLWPWHREKRAPVDFHIAGWLRQVPNPALLVVTTRYRAERSGPLEDRQWTIPVAADGRFDQRLPLGTYSCDFIRLEGSLAPGWVLDLRRFTTVAAEKRD